MIRSRFILLFTPLFLFFNWTYSQQSLLDYIVKEGDTIYGALRSNGTKKLWLYEKKISEDGEVNIKEHRLKGVTTFRKDGVTYHFRKNGEPKKSMFKGRNSIKNFYALIPELQDFIVTANFDTIYGKITNYNGKSIRFINRHNKLEKFKEDEIPAIRYNSRMYRHKKKPLAGYGDDKDYYLMVLAEGEVNLYAHHYGDGFKTKRFFYVEKGEKMVKIPASGYGYIMDELFADDPDLLERLRNKEFTPDNMVIIVQLYNNRNSYGPRESKF